MKKALIFYGGWDGHTPEEAAKLFERELKSKGFEVTLSSVLDTLNDEVLLKSFDLIVPIWTMGTLSGEQSRNLRSAICSGVGLGGFHGGMGDAFRGSTEYEWMVGGHFVGHPHVGDYTVELTSLKSPITEGLPQSFPYKSEQYYMLVEPGLEVLATTKYQYENRTCLMPVVWTKTWGSGRVFYSSLGHTAEELARYPEVVAMTVRGLLWAAR